MNIFLKEKSPRLRKLKKQFNINPPIRWVFCCYHIFICKQIYTMKKIIRLTESDLIRLVKRVIKEENSNALLQIDSATQPFIEKLGKQNITKGIWEKNRPDEITIKPDGISKSFTIEGPTSDLYSLPTKGTFTISMNYKTGGSFAGYTLFLNK